MLNSRPALPALQTLHSQCPTHCLTWVCNVSRGKACPSFAPISAPLLSSLHSVSPPLPSIAQHAPSGVEGMGRSELKSSQHVGFLFALAPVQRQEISAAAQLSPGAKRSAPV